MGHIIQAIWKYKPQDVFLAKFFGKLHFKGMADPRPDSNEAVAERLRSLRWMVANDNQTRFAAELGVETKRWNNFERGSPLSKEVSIMIVRKWPDITLEWLWLGKPEGLTLRRLKALEAAAEELNSGDRNAPRRGRPRSR